MLDVLKEFGARATFMCMTDSIVGPMVALIQRAVDEGHELANHCPADRPYSFDFKANFTRALHQSEAALRPFKRRQVDEPSEAYLRRIDVQRKRKKMKWFRPPNGMMSFAMGATLKEEKYSVALGDCFSNDVLVGENYAPKEDARSQAARKSFVDYHAKFCTEKVKVISFSGRANASCVDLKLRGPTSSPPPTNFSLRPVPSSSFTSREKRTGCWRRNISVPSSRRYRQRSAAAFVSFAFPRWPAWPRRAGQIEGIGRVLHHL